MPFVNQGLCCPSVFLMGYYCTEFELWTVNKGNIQHICILTLDHLLRPRTEALRESAEFSSRPRLPTKRKVQTQRSLQHAFSFQNAEIQSNIIKPFTSPMAVTIALYDYFLTNFIWFSILYDCLFTQVFQNRSNSIKADFTALARCLMKFFRLVHLLAYLAAYLLTYSLNVTPLVQLYSQWSWWWKLDSNSMLNLM